MEGQKVYVVENGNLQGVMRSDKKDAPIFVMVGSEAYLITRGTLALQILAQMGVTCDIDYERLPNVGVATRSSAIRVRESLACATAATEALRKDTVGEEYGGVYKRSKSSV